MRALAKLVAINSPDKILFVGEALVGNEAVDQLTKFDRALKDFSAASGTGKERGIDGMLVTKWDTVDDKVHTLHWFTRGDVDGGSRIGWRCTFNDLCNWATDCVRRVRSGQYQTPSYSRCPLTRESHSDLHGSETVESRKCCGGDPRRLIQIDFAPVFTANSAQDGDGRFTGVYTVNN